MSQNFLTSETPILPVSAFAQLISEHLAVLGEVIVEGEISQLRVSQGRWLFLTIKDESASVEVFAPVFKITSAASLSEGMQVHVYATASLYAKTGRFSLNAYRIVPAGEGSLRLAYEQLRAKLQTEGLFDPARKRTLPKLPERIGLITAVDARAYTDFVKVLSERLGGLEITFYPVSVQGKDSVASILSAFNYFNQLTQPPEVLVLTRGGGSLEDLLSFNDEAVARAVFSSKVPVISAIGHEADMALTDFIADLRASTPSNAAELLVPSRQELRTQVKHLQLSLESSLMSELRDQQRLVSHYAEKLSGVLNLQQQRHKTLWHKLTQHLFTAEHRVQLQQKNRSFFMSQLSQSLTQKLQQNHQKLSELERLLSTLDYQKTLARGFSITRTVSGKIVTQPDVVAVGTQLVTTLAKGTLTSVTQ
jgi:exodeoxyribonuclease VII large subunit